MEDMELKKFFGGIYHGKKVVVTGNTGFKGSWLSFWLTQLGAKVTGIAKDIPTEPSNYKILRLNKMIRQEFLDIRDLDKLSGKIKAIRPDFIFHLAAQAIVSRSYTDPPETFSTNLLGTVNVLECMRRLKKSCVGVIITSDKCYDNQEWDWGYRENDRMGGKDPYSSSKGAAELAFYSYYHSFFKGQSAVRVASARAGNVIGGGDWAVDRIVPDCMRSWSAEEKVRIRNPQATRPWQHVLEPLSGYLLLGMKLAGDPLLNGESFNFGPRPENNFTVFDLISGLSHYWKSGHKNYAITRNGTFHEAGLLKLNCDKSHQLLKWESVLEFQDILKFTAEWYKDFYLTRNSDLNGKTSSQIIEYCKKASDKKLLWTSGK